MHTKSVAELSRSLAAKEFSSVELVEHYLKRIEKLDKEINSYITVTPEFALEQARKADQLIAQKKATPLTGIPIAQKDIFCTQGIKTTCASKMLANFVPNYSATLVENCNQAGMVLLGKTNMDEFAMGSSNENSYFGPVKNPWNHDTVPGGSSGGSAAAVAAMLAPASTATDTGGSIRQPAALTGITGLKPTYGRISRFGMIAFASSLDQGGPMARSAEDIALLMNAMVSHDPKDSTSVNQPVPDYTQTLNVPIDNLTIGLPKEYFDENLNPEMRKVIEEAISVFKKLGAKFLNIDLPHNDVAAPAYYVIAPAECSSNLARYDGVRYGYRCANPKNLEDLYKRSRGEGFGNEVKRRIMIGTYVLSAGYYDAYYLKAQKIRRLIKNDFVDAFAKVDLILGPTTPTEAFKFGEKSKDPINMYLSDVYTISSNLAGIPAISFPGGFINGLPVGIQLVGNYFEEAKLLNVVHQYQKETDWHLKMPEKYNK